MSLLASTRSRSRRRLPRHPIAPTDANEIAIDDHVIDRVVGFCELRDEGKIKGLIHVPRI
jgi:hypothetical protein